MRSIWLARLQLLAVYLATVGWLVGMAVAWSATVFRSSAVRFLGSPDVTVLMLVVLAGATTVFLTRCMPILAARAGLFPGRVIGLFNLIGVVAVWLGALWTIDPSAYMPEGLGNKILLILGNTILLLLFFAAIGTVVVVVRAPAAPRAPVFLFTRSHAADAASRRCVAAITLHGLVVALVVGRVLEFRSELDQLSRVVFLFGAFYVLGVVLSLLQRYPQRSMGLAPYAALLVAAGFVCTWIVPRAEWPVVVLGIGIGLGHAAPRAWLVLLVPPNQRGPAALLAALAAIAGAAAGAGLAVEVPAAALPAVRVLIALVLLGAAIWFLFRELIEQTLEFFLWIWYPVTASGPGLLTCPTRGPVLVLANHAAWLDPIWVAKVIPVQLRPMMISRFFDLPVIRFLMRRVFYAIRVPEVRFRREAPEVQDAIAALERGQNVLIFPEGWLKRKPDTTVRRFGQGIYHILREKPRTPVVACWIEGNWGSYMSFFNGPPTKNKKMDWLHRIRIGVSDPEVLPLELLHDGHQTRRHLMLAVLQARRHLGLDPLPPPPFAAGDDGDENG